MKRRGGFTLIEVLVSIALLSLVLLGLYRSLDIQRTSNRKLQAYLDRALRRDRVVSALYRDLLFSDGNLSLHKGEYDRLCIHRTEHSLYGLPAAQVCWLVLKEGKELLRVEGGNYSLPLHRDDRVAIDRLMGPMELFDLYRKKGELLVVLKAGGRPADAFLLQGLRQPPRPLPMRKRGLVPEKNPGKSYGRPPGNEKDSIERNPDAS
ncbi:prepilin-type N-terminal cleavage/methylation domain-containing protein [Nitratifractor sp.]|uniref:PulJ/GspJ family protein n=1 Tax=Nitratifractor sp. TaxID=2268144 RepID=UPI0025DE2C5B|nr:prepilin-type N-terminal cleavage/methylation domain-containing protein [Nitratifractor sp.]